VRLPSELAALAAGGLLVRCLDCRDGAPLLDVEPDRT
jgi:hypothetical protein